MNTKEKKKAIELLAEAYPDAKPALKFASPYQLLVAVVLSAQCTDARVNIVTKDLFVKYPSVEAFAEADLKELEQDIRPTGFSRSTARRKKWRNYRRKNWKSIFIRAGFIIIKRRIFFRRRTTF